MHVHAFDAKVNLSVMTPLESHDDGAVSFKIVLLPSNAAFVYAANRERLKETAFITVAV